MCCTLISSLTRLPDQEADKTARGDGHTGRQHVADLHVPLELGLRHWRQEQVGTRGGLQPEPATVTSDTRSSASSQHVLVSIRIQNH